MPISKIGTNGLDQTDLDLGLTGNVGIGTSTPTAKLEVIGEIRSTNGTEEVIVSGTNGAIEIVRTAGNPFIDFKSAIAEDFDTRIQQDNNGLTFHTGGNGAASERMRIAGNGNITTPFQPAFFAYCSVGTHTTTPGSVLDFNTIFLDRTSNYNTSTYRFTAPTAGYYIFYCQVYTQNGAVQKSFAWRKNGTQLTIAGDANIWYQGAVNVADITLNGSLMINLVAGDYIDVGVRIGASNVQWYGGHSLFYGYLLG